MEKLKFIECSIKEVFDAIERIHQKETGNAIKFLGNPSFEHYLNDGDIQIQDENENWVNISCLLTKKSELVSLSFEDETGKEYKVIVADKHLIRTTGTNCVLAEDLENGTLVTLSNNTTAFLTQKERLKEQGSEIVYDMTVDTPTHLYQTANGIVHHNTVTAKTVAKVLKRKFFYFNLGAMQDPRASLIGSTLFNTGEGTYFSESEFVKAIRTPYSVILLDEFTRMHPDAGNILMTVLDPSQRYLRLDEKEGQEVINIAEGVSFIATANIGNEYTGTRVTDRALNDRFSVVEMELLEQEEEARLCKMRFPDTDDADIDLLTKISEKVRSEYLTDSPKISNMMSTRMVLEAADLIQDNFTIAEALEITLLPLYDQAGGASSERQHVKQIIDSFLPKGIDGEKTAWKKKVSPDNPFYKTKK